MTDKGLREVANPSAIFLSRYDEAIPGSIVMISREGTRPLLVEVQALVDDAHGQPPCSFGSRTKPSEYAAGRNASSWWRTNFWSGCLCQYRRWLKDY